MWLTTVTVWLLSREGVAKSPCKCGSEGGIYRRCESWNELESKTFFRKSSDGWRDVYNAMDTALRAVESTDCIGPYTIDKSVPVEYGPLTEQETIPDRYPLWFAWIQFRVTFPLHRNNPEIEQYL